MDCTSRDERRTSRLDSEAGERRPDDAVVDVTAPPPPRHTTCRCLGCRATDTPPPSPSSSLRTAGLGSLRQRPHRLRPPPPASSHHTWSLPRMPCHRYAAAIIGAVSSLCWLGLTSPAPVASTARTRLLLAQHASLPRHSSEPPQQRRERRRPAHIHSVNMHSQPPPSGATVRRPSPL